MLSTANECNPEMGQTQTEATALWRKFRDLKIGNVIDLASGETATVLSCPGPTMGRSLLGVEIRVTDGDLTWCAQRPDADVFVRTP